jgi:hypothetical protein
MFAPLDTVIVDLSTGGVGSTPCANVSAGLAGGMDLQQLECSKTPLCQRRCAEVLQFIGLPDGDILGSLVGRGGGRGKRGVRRRDGEGNASDAGGYAYAYADDDADDADEADDDGRRGKLQMLVEIGTFADPSSAKGVDFLYAMRELLAVEFGARLEVEGWFGSADQQGLDEAIDLQDRV